MAYATRWDIPFRDIQGTLHHIYVQQDGWSGNVTTLQGGNTPIDWDEDNSDDLLKRVRAKTGHIEVIEENYGDLVDLFPTTTRSHKVIVPGMFVGYIKPQSSSFPWKSGPRVLKLNIVSALAISNNVNIENFVNQTTLMDDVILSMMRAMGYGYIAMPTGSGSVNDFMNSKINSLLICPYMQGRDFKIENDSDAYEPISVGKLLEMIGQRYDLCAHDACIDQKSVLLLTRFDQCPSSYYLWSYEDLLNNVEPTVQFPFDTETNLFSIGVVADNNNSERLLIPYSGIDVSCEGELLGDESWPYYLSQYMRNDTFIPRGNWLYLNSLFSSLRTIGTDEVVRVESFSLEGTTAGTTLVRVRLRNLESKRKYRAKFNIRGEGTIRLTIKVGNMWVNPQNGGLYSYEFHTDIILSSEVQEYESVYFYCTEDSGNTASAVEVMFSTANTNKFNLTITKFELEAGEYYPLDVPYIDKNFITSIDGTDGSERLEYKLELNNTFWSNYFQSNLEFANLYPEYMLQSQTLVVIKIRLNTSISVKDYLQRYYIDSTGRRWRIVAISQNPRRCEAKITLISSYILE